jgi:hypothetical protein
MPSVVKTSVTIQPIFPRVITPNVAAPYMVLGVRVGAPAGRGAGGVESVHESSVRQCQSVCAPSLPQDSVNVPSLFFSFFPELVSRFFI